MGFDEFNRLWFFQIKTDSWPNENKILEYISKRELNCISINVKPDKVEVRSYSNL